MKPRSSPSLDMPTAKHFFRRQYWQLLRLKGVISHFSSLEHRWFIPWVIQRRKNPCNTKHHSGSLYRPLWIWKGVSATLSSGRYTLSYPSGRYIWPLLLIAGLEITFHDQKVINSTLAAADLADTPCVWTQIQSLERTTAVLLEKIMVKGKGAGFIVW